MSFVHLHAHTEYSLLDGANKITEYIRCVKDLGMNSAAITDHGVMYGVIDFYKTALANGIKPIIGCEVYLDADDNHLEKKRGTYHLILLAENNKGYENLTKIVSKGFVDGFYYKPRVDKGVLREHSEGLIALSACLQGEISRYLINDDYERAKRAAMEYVDIFGADSFFLELQNHHLSMQQKVNQYMMSLSKELNIELVATNDVHYTYKDDYKAQDILLCLQTNKKLNDTDRLKYQEGEFYVRSYEEMLKLFPYAKKAVENTQKIADRCNVEIKFHELKLPKFQLDKEEDAFEYLKKLCERGLSLRYENVTDTLRKRLSFELNTIHKMGYVDYFLIVWDFIKYAKENGISVGPGRGSAAGSLVSYCLYITDVDPIRYNLMFERFLNPFRVSMPDIDIDFDYERRSEVIDYVVEKYGKDRVVQIITFGTMAARGVIRDVGRVMDLPYSMVDEIAKLIPREKDMTIDKAIRESSDIQGLIESDYKIRQLIEMSKKLEGMPRHSSIHAAGVVICGRAALELIPLSRASDGTITTQFTMTTVEELGLLKMDFLGLRTLNVIQNAVNMAGISLANTDEQDENVYKMISKGQTDGVFQLESKGMKSFMQGLKPSCFEDIVAGISLYRPGPMDFIPRYIQSKNDLKNVKYHCKELIPILKSTYGCIVYQEQVMQIVQRLAGYSLGRSDILRRAMSKKKADVMNKERNTFIYGDESENINGCIKNGIDERIANIIFDEMIDFANYAFNKSHSVAYAMVAYRTAFLRYYYPIEFMAALLTSVIDNQTKLLSYIYACREMKIKLQSPNINISGQGFRVYNASIAYALDSIKGVGANISIAIEKERADNGEYKGIYDFLIRNKKNGVNKKAVENLIKAGAFDTLEVNRRSMLMALPELMETVDKQNKDLMSGQGSIFSLINDYDTGSYLNTGIKLYAEYDIDMLLEMEKEVIGFYVSGHPLDDYTEQLKTNTTALAVDFEPSNDEISDSESLLLKDRQIVTLGGVLTEVRKTVTKRGQAMAYATLEDLTGSVDIVVFPKQLSIYDSLLYEGEKLLVNGEVSLEDEKKSKLLVRAMIRLNDVPKRVFVRFKDIKEYNDNKERLLGISKKSINGADELVAYISKEKVMQIISRHFDAYNDSSSMLALYEDFARGHIAVSYIRVYKSC